MSICTLRTILAVLLADLEGVGAWADRDIGAKISFHARGDVEQINGACIVAREN